MTYKEYCKRGKLIERMTVLFITADVIITLLGMIVDGIVTGLTGPNPIFVLMMFGVMIIHGVGSVYLDKELEKDYEANKID